MFFHKNGTVEVFPYGIGDVKQIGEKNTSLIISEPENHALDSILQKYLSSDLGRVRVSDILNVEEIYRKEYHSNVKVDHR